MNSRLSHHLHINIGPRTVWLQEWEGLYTENAAYKGAHRRLLHCVGGVVVARVGR